MTWPYDRVARQDLASGPVAVTRARLVVWWCGADRRTTLRRPAAQLAKTTYGNFHTVLVDCAAGLVYNYVRRPPSRAVVTTACCRVVAP